MSKQNYEILLKKLDAFIDKYYKNRIIKGFLYLLLISLSLFILLAISEYFFEFSSRLRGILVISYLIVFLVLLLRFIILPALALFRIYSYLNYQQASKIIGKHFPEIGDKLSNVLQLHDLEEINQEQRLLIEAGINQKAENLKPYPILTAVNFKSNVKYLKWVFIPVGIILLTWLLQPQFVEEPTKRLVQYNQEFEKQWPFSIYIENEELKAFQKEDFDLSIRIEGTEWPENLYIHFYNSRYLLQKKSGNSFHYLFKNLRKTTKFFFSDGTEFKTHEYQLEVFPKASFNSFEVDIIPPAYTQLNPRTEKNISDLKAPHGSILKYKLKSSHADSLMIYKNKESYIFGVSDNNFEFNDTLTQSIHYKIISGNTYLRKSDSLMWSVNTISDEYPRIQVESVRDSNESTLLYFNGMINDDYGFSRLRMIIEIGDFKTYQNINFNAYTRPQRFYHFIDLEEINQEKGVDLIYYFEVSDNDGWNGPKSARTQKEIYHYDSKKELEKKRDQNSNELRSEMTDQLKEWKDIQKRIKDFQKELLEKELLSWEDKKKMEDLLKEQEKLQKKINEFQEQNKSINEQSKDLEQNQRILDKQEQLQDLFEQVMDEETKKKMEELRKMLEEMNKENAQELLEQMELSAEDLEEQLDRNLELFKQLEFEMRMEENIENLKELAEKQKELADETKAADADKSDSLQQKQDSINQAFEDIKEEIQKLDSLNKSLEEPNKFDKKEEEQKEVDSLQQNAEEKLEQQKMKEASEDQEKASEKMQEMAMEMQAEMDENSEEEMGEDIDNLRHILDQLIQLSFLQEDLMDSLLHMQDMDPKYNQLVRHQFSMESKFQSVKDSLQALAKRQPAIQPFVLKEFNKIDFRLQSTTDFLEEHKKNEAIREQQFVMTSFNQLALMLAEALEQMQQMMNNMMQGNAGAKSKSCPKPGGGKPSAKSMKQMQQQLNEQMKALEKAKKDGKQKGPKGNKGQGLSEQFARMAAEQAKIRRMMEEYQNQMLDETGTKPGGLDQLMKEMEETEKDLVNKIINQETLNRQQNIMTRLLKSEKAEREREKKEERESKEGKNVKRSNPKEFLKYKEIKEKDINLMRTIPLDFNQYYKKKVDEYFYKFENIDEDVEKKRISN